MTSEDANADEGTHSTAMAQDGVSAMTADKGVKGEGSTERDDAEERADPSKGNRDGPGHGRTKSDKGEGQGAADEQATIFKRSI